MRTIKRTRDLGQARKWHPAYDRVGVQAQFTQDRYLLATSFKCEACQLAWEHIPKEAILGSTEIYGIYFECTCHATLTAWPIERDIPITHPLLRPKKEG